MRRLKTDKRVIRPIHLVAATRIKSQSAADVVSSVRYLRMAEDLVGR